jgi:hypothetical protein
MAITKDISALPNAGGFCATPPDRAVAVNIAADFRAGPSTPFNWLPECDLTE